MSWWPLQISRSSPSSAWLRSWPWWVSSSPSLFSCTHARDELRRNRKFCRSEAHGFLRRRGIDAVDLEEDAARFDLRHPIFRRALAGTHAHLGGFFGHRHVGEDADPHTAGALHLARDRTTCRFDFARSEAFGFQRFEAIGAEVELRARLGRAVNA